MGSRLNIRTHTLWLIRLKQRVTKNMFTLRLGMASVQTHLRSLVIKIHLTIYETLSHD